MIIEPAGQENSRVRIEAHRCSFAIQSTFSGSRATEYVEKPYFVVPENDSHLETFTGRKAGACRRR